MANSKIGVFTPAYGLKAHLHEAIKMHHVYDRTNRLVQVYVAPAEAADGAPAILTTYSYDGTSNRIVGMKEEWSSWDNAWDI